MAQEHSINFVEPIQMESNAPQEFCNIYKYVSFEIGETIIRDFSLKFTNPKYFNDPFDCDIAGIYFDLNGSISPKIQSEIEQLRKEFWFANLSDEMLIQAYKETITDKLNKSVATCFSLDDNNHLMWSHYANNHHGICLGFDNSISIKEKFTDLELGLEGEIVYGCKEKINFCADKITGNQKLYLTKLSPWAYEKEYRLIAIADEGIYHFKREFLKSIILGLRVKQEQKDRMLDLASEMNLNVKVFSTEARGADLVYSQIR